MNTTKQNFPDNTLYELDNLAVLRGMNSETVDLIATDPPFNTKRNRAATAGFYVDNWKWGDTGKLPDQWAWNEVHPKWLEEVRDENEALYEVIETARSCHSDDLGAFLCFLGVRLLEMHRVLKPTGSLYLHIDHTAHAYVKLVLDAIFGHRHFRNEIVWCYGPSNTKRWFPRKHDIILFYAKSEATTFNRDAVRIPYRRVTGTGYNSLARGDRTDAEVAVLEKEYRQRGKVPEDWWTDIAGGGHISKHERTGSPDQKPLALYERIILASSNPGELVLDPFAGCATTIIAARKHDRRWIGIDRRTDARYHVVCRMAEITPDAREKLRQRADLSAWLDSRLARYDAHYATAAPERTDDGATAPVLPQVYSPRRPATMRRDEMVAALAKQWGRACWGCGFEPPDIRYLELDHIAPASEGGSNELENRALLCGPCNREKSNSSTFTGLRRANKRDGRWYGRHQQHEPINLVQAKQWAEHYLEQRGQQQRFPI